MFFDHDADKTFERSQNRAMQHDWTMFRAVCTDVIRVQTFRQNKVHLQGATLPITTNRVGQNKLKLWPIKSTFARVEFKLISSGLGRGFQRTLGFGPDVVLASAGFRPIREFYLEVFKSKVCVYLGQEFDEKLGFSLDLILAAENMRIVLRKAANTHDTMQSARWFVTVARTKLGHAQRQIAVRFQTLIIDLYVTRAVHRLQSVDGFFAGMFLVHFDDKHVFLILFPMARGFPQLAVNDLRGVHLDIAAALLLAAHIVLKGGVYFPAVRMPENLTRSFFLHVEQVHLAAQLAVITLLRFFQTMQVILEVLLGAESHAVNTLQHRVFTVTAPIGSGNAHQLETIARNLAGVC